ncbi:hypothetical protein PIROE2DRAFT_14221 [Piromyces sp. E2]|nr:hypothetical protein PIROE2DRAFT_14221 [Piromyces sp. E2]|eukprot:OUM60095.1 hypothetical protein PIROE2DRAFT_14221 [Piromyces sp. E2]
MKIFIYFLNITSIILNLINARYIKKDDDYYLIYVNNTYRKVSNNNIHQKRQEPQQFVNSIMEEIHQLIIDNRNTYNNPKELDVLEEKNAYLKKRNNNINVNDVFQISSLDDISVLYSYFSYDVNEKVKALPGIIGSEPIRKMTIGLPNEKIISANGNKIKKEYYDGKNIDDIIDEIKKETNWDDVEIRKSSDLHLSLLSQGPFNGTMEQYDTNYYYPKSAGKDIDIYIVDSSFDFRHPEFSNKERITKCLGYIVSGTLVKPISDDYCISSNFHGELVSESVGGLKHGAASKANIYGIALALDGPNGGDFNSMSFLLALDYILNNIPMRPHKSIINFSMGEAFPIYDFIFIYYSTKIFNKFRDKGVIVFAAAGNDGNPIFDINKNRIYLPCAIDSVICVGGIDIIGNNTDPNITDEQVFSKQMNPKNYARANYSNYGKKVDIYAPFSTTVSLMYKDITIDLVSSGTSFSCPIVAGVAATIMSEHPEIKFNTKSMLSYLNKLGHKNIIENILEGPNVLVNNGKHSIYLNDILTDENDENINNNNVERAIIEEYDSFTFNNFD